MLLMSLYLSHGRAMNQVFYCLLSHKIPFESENYISFKCSHS